MPRRSAFWVFNIRQDNWEYCINGPTDSGRYGASNVGNPWFGKQSSSLPELREGDLVFARRTTRSREGEKGDKPYGVMGLWRYSSKRTAKPGDSLPWTGGPYEWILHLREIERFDQPYQENYDKLPFISQSLQSDLIGLRPEYARGYFEQLSDQGHISRETLKIARKHFETIDSSATDTSHPPPSVSMTEPKRYTTTVDRRLRNQHIVKEIKDIYSHKCQICRDRRLQNENIGYSEVHHIQPLGRPHIGTDIMNNMIVLCPNHHADFDNGVVSIDPDSRVINHLYEQAVDGRMLHSQKPHTVSKEYLEYHVKEISMLKR